MGHYGALVTLALMLLSMAEVSQSQYGGMVRLVSRDFLAPTGAQGMLILVHLFVHLVQNSGLDPYAVIKGSSRGLKRDLKGS